MPSKAFKDISNVTEEAYGVVAIEIVGVFSWFVDHCDECSFPGCEKLEVTGGEEQC